MPEKCFEKINIKTLISIDQNNPVRNFYRLEELQIFVLNLQKKNMNGKNFEKNKR